MILVASGGSDGKSICLQCRRPGFDPWFGKILWRRKWQPIPVFLPGKFHGQRSLVGYSPWGRKELATSERVHLMTSGAWQVLLMVKNPPASVRSLGREDPLEDGMAIYSSILAWRIPLDRGAWRATVQRMTQSQTWLKRVRMQWLVMLSIFLCAYWQFAYLLKRNVYSDSLSIFCLFVFLLLSKG